MGTGLRRPPGRPGSPPAFDIFHSGMPGKDIHMTKKKREESYVLPDANDLATDRKSTRLNSSHT